MTGIIGKISSRSKIVNEPLTDGGVLLGSGADAVTATAALADSEMIVGDGTTDPAIESGATLRTSIGVGTGDAVTFGAITGTTLDTGQGANELYDMNQNVKTDSAVTFTTVDTGQGANELYDMDQNVKTDSAVTFATVNTGQGANELYDMNQNVLTTSGVTHDKLTATTGVLFGTDTAAANTLDDYEEGTWTATISNGTTTMTGSNTMQYTKIGNMVTVTGYIVTSSVNGLTSENIKIYTLPFQCGSASSAYSAANCGYGGGLNITAGLSVSVQTEVNQSYLHLKIWDAAYGTTAMIASEWSDNGSIMVCISYIP